MNLRTRRDATDLHLLQPHEQNQRENNQPFIIVCLPKEIDQHQ